MWRGFKIAEIITSYNINKIRIGVVDNQVERLLLSRFLAKDNPLYLKHAVHMFAENSPAVDHNDVMLNVMEGETISINAIDDIPHEVHLPDKWIDAIMVRMIADTGN